VNDCIESHLKPHRLGYAFKQVGSRSDGTRRKVPHHRWVYAHHHGLDLSQMEGMDVCHSCDNPACINVDHLWLGTRSDNMQDMMAKGRGRKATGSRNVSTKLTEYAVLWIRSYYQMGTHNQVELAEMFGVTQVNTSSIVRRETWRHVS
jgi:hypothetical protein